jgi:ATP-dependent DNA helicase RecG
MTIEELLDSLQLGEDQDVEFKAAQGGFPKSVWETVSAFANTSGGNIILGVVENNGEFEIVGINKPQTLIKDFWDTHFRDSLSMAKVSTRYHSTFARYHSTFA